MGLPTKGFNYLPMGVMWYQQLIFFVLSYNAMWSSYGFHWDSGRPRSNLSAIDTIGNNSISWAGFNAVFRLVCFAELILEACLHQLMYSEDQPTSGSPD